MKIKLRVDIHGPEGNFKAGDVVEGLSEGLMNGLVSGGYALDLTPLPEIKEKSSPSLPPSTPPVIKPTRKRKLPRKEH